MPESLVAARPLEWALVVLALAMVGLLVALLVRLRRQ